MKPVKKEALPYKPRVLRQVLVLVFVPLLAVTFLLLVLRQLSFQSEEALVLETQQGALVRSLSILISQWAGVRGRKLAGGTIKGGLEGSIENPNRDFREWFSRLNKLPMRHRPNKDRIRKLSRLMLGEQNDELKLPTLPASTNGSNLFNSAQTLLQLQARTSELHDLTNIEWQEQKRLIEDADKVQQSQKSLLIVACFADFVLATALVFAAAQAFAMRFNALIRNAGRIAYQEPLPGRVKGNDELAYLDTVLAQVHEQLIEAAELRGAIVGMVAHDLRSPLMSCQVDIQIIEEIADNLSDGGFRALDLAYKDISGMLSYANELLVSQRSLQTEKPAKEANEPSLDIDRRAALLELGGPKLLHKALLLVLLPLLLQTAILGFVYFQMKSSESATRQSRWFTEVIVDKHLAHMDLVSGATSRAIFAYTGNQKFRDAADRAFQRVIEKNRELEVLTQGDQSWSDLVRDSKNNFSKQLDEINKISSPEDVPDVLTKLSEVKAPNPEVQNERRRFADLSALELKKLETSEAAELKSSRDLSNFLGCGILANFALAMALLLWFNRNTRKRLSALIHNVSTLTESEALTEKVSGSDELTYLDLVLRSTRAQLQEETKQRLELVSSLKSKMSASLQNASLQLSRFEEIERESLPAQAFSSLKHASKNIGRTIDLIPILDTLEIFSAGKLQIETERCDSLKLAQEALEVVSSLSRLKEITLVNNCRQFEFDGDKNRLLQVLTNYLSNAIKFSPKGSSVTLAAEKLADGSICMSVSDQGPGMDEITKAKIFDRYFQASSELKKQGFGLGLAICKLIIESHKGMVGVESRQGGGSTFRFEIPSEQSQGRDSDTAD